MPGHVPPVADEREGLLASLARQRRLPRIAAHGPTEVLASIDGAMPWPRPWRSDA